MHSNLRRLADSDGSRVHQLWRGRRWRSYHCILGVGGSRRLLFRGRLRQRRRWCHLCLQLVRLGGRVAIRLNSIGRARRRVGSPRRVSHRRGRGDLCGLRGRFGGRRRECTWRCHLRARLRLRREHPQHDLPALLRGGRRELGWRRRLLGLQVALRARVSLRGVPLGRARRRAHPRTGRLGGGLRDRRLDVRGAPLRRTSKLDQVEQPLFSDHLRKYYPRQRLLWGRPDHHEPAHLRGDRQQHVRR